MNEVVSIIITTYNRADLIVETIDSCLRQTYPHFEVIVIDDGSTDNTGQKLQDYIAEKKIVYFYKTNEERAVARNTGALKSIGQYVKFLDSDDLLEPDYLEKCLQYFHLNERCEAVYTNIKVLIDGRISLSRRKKSVRKIYDRLWELNDIAYSSVMMKLESFFKYGKFDETRSLSGAEDWEFWVRMSYQGADIQLVEEYLTIIRTHGNNNTMNDVHKIVDSSEVALRLLEAKYNVSEVHKIRFKARMLFLHSIYANLENRKMASLQYLIAAIKKDPRLLKKKDVLFMTGKLILPLSFINAMKRVVKENV